MENIILRNVTEALSEAEIIMGYKEFYDCFADDMDKFNYEYGISKHLWNKFVSYEHSLLRLWRVLDNTNRTKLITYISNRFNKLLRE